MTSRMARELAEAPARVRTLLERHEPPYRALAEALRTRPPAFALTVARGSSDHAATYAAALFGILAGRVTASLPPSLITRYGARPEMRGAFALAVSQSGRSPDLVAALERARAGGARCAALLNDTASPLAALAHHVLPQAAGPEGSVAATKSVLCTMAGIALLAALWAEEEGLRTALAALPDRLAHALSCDWRPALAPLAGASSLFVVARGPALGIAQEMALKFKETAGLHAEAVSAAEIRHGPRAALAPATPVLALALADPGGEDSRSLAAELAGEGGTVLCAAAAPGPGLHLPLPPPLHPLLDPLVALQAFYPLAEALARARGRDPDRPPGLSKVTRTL